MPNLPVVDGGPLSCHADCLSTAVLLLDPHLLTPIIFFSLVSVADLTVST